MSQAPSAAELAAINQVAEARQRALVEVFEANFAENFQSPVVFLDNMQLQSPLSVRFYRRDFAYLSRQLYLEYQYRSWRGYNPEVLDRYNEVITKKLTNINIMFTNTINRLEKLLQQNSVVMESSLFPNPVKVTVPVIASHARAYFQLLSDLDRVNLLAGTANLLGVIDSKQRTEAEFICKKAVRAFRSILMNEVSKLYREAKRVMEEQKNGGKVDASMSAIVAEQGKEIAAFESTADEGAEADSALALGNTDPSQLIDDAAAAAVAASAATKGRKKAASTTA